MSSSARVSSQYDTSFKNREDFYRICTLKNKKTGTVWNLTGYQARMQMWTSAGGSKLIEWKTSGLSATTGFVGYGTITLGGTAGTIRWDTPNAVTQLLSPGEYPFELELVTNTGEIIPILSGVFTVIDALIQDS